MRFIDARIHGVLDIVVILVFLLAPAVFGLGASPAAIASALAAVHLVMTLLTRFPMGIRKVIPFFVHGIVELIVGVVLVVLPTIEGYAPGSPARRFYTLIGAAILVIWALTAYRTGDQRPEETAGKFRGREHDDHSDRSDVLRLDLGRSLQRAREGRGRSRPLYGVSRVREEIVGASEPRAETLLERDSLRILRDALERLEAGFVELPAVGAIPGAPRGMEVVLYEVAERLRDNYPYFHPLYAGQMLKPPHPVARAAYALAMWINPNNHALDGGRSTNRSEREAVAEFACMFGWESCLGHLCGGGTMANLEALWVAGRLRPGEAVVASAQAHHPHQRIGGVLGLSFETVACDRRGRLDVEALEARLSRGGVGTVVATMGTTATGSVDPLPALLALRERYGFRLHADAAYGGYFVLAENLAPEARAAYDRLGEADSIVIDPHKHGLQPYGCGAVLFRDPSVGRFYKHESPYTYFSSAELHLGEISLECSRPGAAALALGHAGPAASIARRRIRPRERGGPGGSPGSPRAARTGRSLRHGVRP